jgi:glucosamine--fructose-6-phosphate aminotransferase (isomerizing)
MCGIIGVTGSDRTGEVLLGALTALEYRGYDSAGMAFVEGSGLPLVRFRAAEGTTSIQELGSTVADAPENGAAAIGHTRWATHGAPTVENAHPHFDCGGRLALVHNGIIENYRELADELTAAGHTFSSVTDTEVVVHLIEEQLKVSGSLFEAARVVLADLRGDYALAVISADEPDVLVAARRTSPLIVGLAGETGYVGSDIAALLAWTRELYQLADGEIAEVGRGVVRATDLAGNPVSLAPLNVAWTVADAQKDGYPDFMSKEIREQPRAVADTLIGRLHDDGSSDIEELSLTPERLAQIDRVVFVAAGSSYHAGLVGRYAVEHLVGIPAEVEYSSEFRYRDAVLSANTLVIAISQSGETADTLHALREASRLGATTIAMTNVVDSLMAREADGVLYTHAGPEIGVASTKCHLAQLTMIEIFALHLASAKGRLEPADRRAIAGDLLALPELVTRTLASVEAFEAVAEKFVHAENFYFLGRRLGLPIALEGALKLKELAYVRAEAYAAGEMKHGPISLVEAGSIVVVIATRTDLWEKVRSNIEEMRARGATILAVCEEGDEATAALADSVLCVPATSELTSPIVDVVPMQILAYTIARARGLNVDRPRNLAKVVTVE